VPHLHLDLTQPSTHLVRATMDLEPRHRCLRFSLPAWTPGSYLIRDYVRQLEGLVVLQGERELPLRRCGVASWSVDLPALEPLAIHYRLLAADLSVRTCHLSDEHGFLVLAALALEVEGERWQPHGLSLALPEGWQAFLPLPPAADGGWLAPSFDDLIDSPVEVGPHRCHTFTVAGVPHRWVGWGQTLAGTDLLQQDPGWLQAVEQIALACCRVMGLDGPPGPYLFVLHLTDSGFGGLEHDHSCVLQFGRRSLAQQDGRRRLLQLVAHEYLHQWNVRRLRPAELSPYSYGEAVVVPTLWFAEGVTSYLDQLIPHLAGLCSEEELLEDLGKDLSRYLICAGRRVQSLRQSSEEAWVKLYKPDPYSANSQVSYYLKGQVLALVLDLWLRRQGSALVDVLRSLWRSHGAHGRGYQEADLIAAFRCRAGDLGSLLPAWLQGTEDPPLEVLLADVGLQLEPELAAQPWLGLELEASSGTLQVKAVGREGPAEQAGLMVGDELLAVDGWRVRQPADLDAPLASADASLVLTCCRDGRLQQRSLEPQPPHVSRWRLVPVQDADPATAACRRVWLCQELPN
jgi:predicted metalloprotease with PDZ domain